MSALNLSEAERQEINTKLQGLTAGSLMAGQQMQELLMDTNLDDATKKLILSETGLTNAIGENTIATTANVTSKLQDLVADNLLDKEIADSIITKMADVTATNTQTSANLGLAASFKTLMASMGPIGWISIGISLLVSAFQLIAPHIKSANEQLEETHQALADIRSERENLNNELKTTEERIAELEAKGALSFTDEAELNRLRQENAELERKLILLDDEEKKEEEKYRKKFNKLIGRDSSQYDVSIYDLNQSMTAIEYLKELGKARDELEATGEKYITSAQDRWFDIEDIQGYIDTLGKTVGNYQKYLSDLYEYGFDYSTADEETKKNVDYANEMIDTYMVVIGKTDTLWSQVYNRDRFAEARKAIEELAVSGQLSADSLQNLYNQGGNVKEFVDYMLSLDTVDWKTMLGDKFADVAGEDNIVSLDEALKAMSSDTELASKIMGLFANELNKVEDAAEGAATATTAWTNLSKTISGMVDKYDVLKEAQKELAESGNLSADMLDKLAEKYPELNDDIGEYLFGLISQEEFMRRLQGQYDTDYQNYQKSLQAKLNTSTEYWNKLSSNHAKAINAIANTYEVDFKNCKTVEEAKAKIRKTYMTQWMQDYNKYVELSLSEAQQLRRDLLKRNKNGTYTQKIADLDAYIQSFKKIDADFNSIINTVNLDKFSPQNLTSTDFDKDSGKTEAEKYFDKLKYQLETNQITQEKYLKDLDWGYKHFYNKTAEYLEDYAKYSQEVYDGFKDMYKEDLEAQKEAWEEKKDAVSEYYDNLREQIEDAHDEEDYEKERDEKRKEIFELDIRINELLKAAEDGSEKAKARIAELEEERLKAEEEYRDFETNKARENELARLEKEQEAEEKKIQDQIDTIDKELETIDEDIVSVRNAIINYAAKKGVTLDFAYASGTRSSVGGFGRINEKGIEMISAPDGNGNYIPMLPSSYVFSAKATEFLWKLATEHSLPQAMYNSIAKSIKTQSSTPSVNIAQPINITMGDVIIKGNADKQTVADIKKQQDNTVRMVLQKIKELQK